jgi:ferredoxin-NADP reductase
MMDTNMETVKHVPQVSSRAVPVQATVIGKAQLADQMLEVTLELAADQQPVAFTAGQFAMVKVAEGVTRAYSLASLPGDLPKLVFCVGTKAGGLGSKFFENVKVGDSVNLTVPYGIFTVKSHDRPLLFVATGSGIAPFKSMVLQLLADGFSQEVHLLFGVRSEADLFYAGYFEDLAARHPNFKFVATLSQASDTWHGARGRVTSHLELASSAYLSYDVYICGSKQMIVDVRALFVAKGLPPLSMKFEVFN